MMWVLWVVAGCLIDEHVAQCLGWCEAHGYEKAVYYGTGTMPFDVNECWCAAPVGSDAALAPIPPLPAEALGS